MARERARWEAVETFGPYEFQINQYEEKRIISRAIKNRQSVFRTFHGYNAHEDAKRYWGNLKLAMSRLYSAE